MARLSVEELLDGYSVSRLSVAAVASHSALDVFDGAKEEGFRTVAVCQRGRELAYLRFPVVDEHIILEKFSDMVDEAVQLQLRRLNAVIVPNRSMAVYVGYEAIEERLRVPVFGNRYLLRWEERRGEKNYYRLLDEAGIRRPKVFGSPDEIDRPVIVKVGEAVRRFERGFFIAFDRDDFWKKARRLVEDGILAKDFLKEAVIEELVLGAHFNVNYFYSVALRRLELHSIDRRIQTSLDTFYRLPADVQVELVEAGIYPRYVEIGHEPATIRERMLNKLFEIGDKFVEAAARLEPPGVIGPFTLQLMVTPDLDVVVFDVAPRIGGGTNIYLGVGSQYSKLYFGKPLSMGRRIALEIRLCIENYDCLHKIVT